jgi:hypothetical protein
MTRQNVSDAVCGLEGSADQKRMPMVMSSLSLLQGPLIVVAIERLQNRHGPCEYTMPSTGRTKIALNPSGRVQSAQASQHWIGLAKSGEFGESLQVPARTCLDDELCPREMNARV